MRFKLTTTTLLALGTAIIMSGCGAKGPTFSKIEKPEKDMGLVYIYRPSSFIGGGIYYDIHVTDQDGNDKVIGTLRNGGYFQYTSQPGEKEFWAKTEAKSSVTIDIEPNKMYCIKGEVGIGFIAGRPHLTVVDNKLCEEEIKDTQLSSD
ncbi:DUF2846 domain-containing protein [Sulfurimonas sp. HSL-3221]|uniref:DUF2846 domain-containing protein n=1 Tax=Sulfurimonadaceae TaxID=2771471 RepID=UPI001E3733E6|nr:DUF2846 domain-containing protein [Sulfurimonas sp. HSL-3221]UFS61834.1 DUF2846 domain-containing protein [Sulfurimonas sp. HSL-3221]